MNQGLSIVTFAKKLCQYLSSEVTVVVTFRYTKMSWKIRKLPSISGVNIVERTFMHKNISIHIWRIVKEKKCQNHKDVMHVKWEHFVTIHIIDLFGPNF